MIKQNKKGTAQLYSSSENSSLAARVFSSNIGYQELIDYSSTGRKRPWNEKKINSTLVGDAFSRISQVYQNESEYFLKKADKIYQCGSYLEFHRGITDGSLTLAHSNFCRLRLCPMCNWRRSLKIFSQVSTIMDSMQSNSDYDYLFLTLTIRNVDGPELKDAISELINGFSRLIRRKKIANTILGTFRALEVTYNEIEETYHPHLHIVLCVKKSYFTYQYITQKEWSDLWCKSMKLDYKPVIHIKKIKGDKKAAVAEAAKYATKEEDLFEMDENEERKAIDEVVYTLDEALRGRRLIAFTGVFKEYQQKLKLDDVENGDLVHVENESIRQDLKYVIERYHWKHGVYITRIQSSDIA